MAPNSTRRRSASSLGISETLREFLEDWQDQTGIRVDGDLTGEVRLLPDREVQILRIAQEALANVRKHADARVVRVRWSSTSDAAHLEVSDDGRGFDPARPAHDGRPHFGLLTMRERAHSIDGNIRIETAVGQGTEIRLSVPLGRRGLGAIGRGEP